MRALGNGMNSVLRIGQSDSGQGEMRYVPGGGAHQLCDDRPCAAGEKDLGLADQPLDRHTVLSACFKRRVGGRYMVPERSFST